MLISTQASDIVVIGAGIAGLGAALAARREGLSVTVVDRHARAVGASIRNFGFVTVTGQGADKTWARAKRSRDVWTEVAPRAGIPILHEGLLLPVILPESVAVLEEFMHTHMAEGVKLLDRAALLDIAPFYKDMPQFKTALHSPHDLRVEPRTAIPALARWLETQGVNFIWGAACLGIQPGRVTTSHGVIEAKHIAICAGEEIMGLYPALAAAQKIRRCQLQMLRLRPRHAIKLPAAIMGELSLARYKGYSELPAAQKLRPLLDPEMLEWGVHLIVVQSADGSLVVGDSHVYDDNPLPFAQEKIDALILKGFADLMPVTEYDIEERWTGIYPSGTQDAFMQPSASPAARA